MTDSYFEGYFLYTFFYKRDIKEEKNPFQIFLNKNTWPFQMIHTFLPTALILQNVHQYSRFQLTLNQESTWPGEQLHRNNLLTKHIEFINLIIILKYFNYSKFQFNFQYCFSVMLMIIDYNFPHFKSDYCFEYIHYVIFLIILFFNCFVPPLFFVQNFYLNLYIL